MPCRKNIQACCQNLQQLRDEGEQAWEGKQDLLRERGVEDPFFAKALQQASCASEHSAKTDIFSEDQCPIMIASCFAS